MRPWTSISTICLRSRERCRSCSVVRSLMHLGANYEQGITNVREVVWDLVHGSLLQHLLVFIEKGGVGVRPCLLAFAAWLVCLEMELVGRFCNYGESVQLSATPSIEHTGFTVFIPRKEVDPGGLGCSCSQRD